MSFVFVLRKERVWLSVRRVDLQHHSCIIRQVDKDNGSSSFGPHHPHPFASSTARRGSLGSSGAGGRPSSSRQRRGGACLCVYMRAYVCERVSLRPLICPTRVVVLIHDTHSCTQQTQPLQSATRRWKRPPTPSPPSASNYKKRGRRMLGRRQRKKRRKGSSWRCRRRTPGGSRSGRVSAWWAVG